MKDIKVYTTFQAKDPNNLVRCTRCFDLGVSLIREGFKRRSIG